MFEPRTSLLEIVLRVLLIYLFLLVAMRLFGRILLRRRMRVGRNPACSLQEKPAGQFRPEFEALLAGVRSPREED